MVSFNQILRSVAIAAAFVAVTNCSESATSPTSANSLNPSFSRHSGQGGHGRSDGFDAGVNGSTFTLDGGSQINFSSSSICQLGKSGYGASYWNSGCDAATNNVHITWTSSNTASGHPRYDFQPAMRFVPGHDVILVIYDPIAANNPNSYIAYCNDANVCVNEGLTDHNLITYHDTGKGIIWRKIRHFSGYAVTGDCDPSVDPSCNAS